ncbi:MAG: hypothetical protein HRT64_15265 [Erythrobacter sp.]|nr:hypothetical protein [Erythrobacter sp.]
MSMFGRKRKMMGDPNTAENIDLYRSQQGMSAPQERTGPNWGEIGRNVLGNIGDAISTYYGGAPTFAPLQRQALAFQQQGQLLAERQRQQAELQNQRIAAQDRQWRERAEFSLANPNDALSQSLRGAGVDLQSPEATALYNQRAQTIARGPDPIVQGVSLGPGRGLYTGPLSGLEGAMQAGQPNRPPAQRPALPRPENMSDGDLMTQARKAIANGADPSAVRQRLMDWGVRDPAMM